MRRVVRDISSLHCRGNLVILNLKKKDKVYRANDTGNYAQNEESILTAVLKRWWSAELRECVPRTRELTG